MNQKFEHMKNKVCFASSAVFASASLFSVAFAEGEASGTSSFSVENLLNGLAKKLGTWGGALVTLLGVAMILVACIQIFKGLTSSQGRGSVNWLMVIVLLVVGGIFAFTGGWQFVTDVATGTGNELKDLGNGGGN